jgi:poly-gamma-glutamate synthesis protein (capsule biosynthesis protein)
VPSPTPTLAATATATPAPTATPVIHLGLDPDLPAFIAEAARSWAAGRGVQVVDRGEGTALRLDLAASSDAILVSESIYVPVVRFASLREGIALKELQQGWTDGGERLRLLLAEETAADLSRLWGAPGPTVEMVPDAELTAALWEDQQALGIVPFERLEPRLKPLRLDTLSVVDNRLRQGEWPLALRVWLHGSGAEAQDLLTSLQGRVPPTNRRADQLTVLVMTGVTAMSRGTACMIEKQGDPSFPAHVVGSELAAADITHISNEVPFVADCEARCLPNVLTLCSKPEYMAALEAVGVDIVGLTGNHQNDFGHEAMLDSLALYAEYELPVYGGGANDDEARKPLQIRDHGNRLAFLGANQFGPQAAWATADDPGSARFDLATMQADIAAVRPEADLVLVELQYTEAYQTEPLTTQREDFRALSAAGADIVTGVQAHQPQALEFTADGLILYGLGNLFFDQMDWWETRQGLIARHTIYDGRHVSTELLVTILEEWAQPRWATPEERDEVLGSVFAASGW